MDDFFSDFRSPMRSNLFSDLRSPRRTNLRSRMPDMPNMSNMSNMPNMPNIRAPPTASEVYTEIRTTGGKLLPPRMDMNFSRNLKPDTRKRFSVILKKDKPSTNNIMNYVCETGDLNFLSEMYGLGADITARNEDGKTPLITACEYGQAEVVKSILEWLKLKPDDKGNNNKDKVKFTGGTSVVDEVPDEDPDEKSWKERLLCCIKRPVEDDNSSCAQLFTNKAYDTTSPLYMVDNQGRNCLYVAIAHNHREVVDTLLDLGFAHVRPLLECSCVVLDKKTNVKYHDSPLRMMMRKMPDIANKVLDKYIDRSKEDDSIWECYYYLLDDSHIHKCEAKKCDCNTTMKARTVAKAHHPLMLAYSGQSIINHHLVTSLLYLKWRRVRPIHFLMLFWYLIFMVLITAYMLSTQKYQPPLNSTHVEVVSENEQDARSLHQYVLAMLLAVMSAVGIITEVIQILLMRRLYIENKGQAVQNAMDWTMYVFAIWVVVFPLDGFRTALQWEVGSACMIVSWFNFLLHHPVFCNYLLMVVEVLAELWRFTVVFILFLFMFGLAFAVVLNNQAEHGTVFGSVIRTWTMMLGDIGYGDMFHPDDFTAEVRYRTVTYILFILFLLLGLIITNMWTGFIINRLSTVEQMATIRKLQMQLDYILTLECFLPKFIKPCFVFTRPSKRFMLGMAHSSFVLVVSTLLGDMKFSMPTREDVQSADKLKYTSAAKAEEMISSFKSMMDKVNKDGGAVENGDDIKAVHLNDLESSAPSTLQ